MTDAKRIFTLLPAVAIWACASGPEEAAPLPTASSAPSASEAEIAQVREVRAGGLESPDELICRRETRVGSHLPVRVCQTRAEREAGRRDAQDTMRSLPEKPMPGPEEKYTLPSF